jgi:hypothetical protein
VVVVRGEVGEGLEVGWGVSDCQDLVFSDQVSKIGTVMHVFPRRQICGAAQCSRP